VYKLSLGWFDGILELGKEEKRDTYCTSSSLELNSLF
jgi:hypothetical protein